MLYPEIEPYQSGFLPVDAEHVLYWELNGNKDGIPVVFLHGGPGGCTETKHRQFFDPSSYKIILFDQRGGGKSLPLSTLRRNTTWHLVSDMEALRKHLGIDRWVVFGGSWGSTLALCYAIKHAKRVMALIVRGIFLGRPQDLHWFYQSGANHLFPDAWEGFIAAIPNEERDELLQAYYKRLTSTSPTVRRNAAMAWYGWEIATMRLQAERRVVVDIIEEEHAERLARIECHYFVNKLFLEGDNWILENVDKIRGIPGIIIQGRYDMPCPVQSAWDLHKAWPEAQLEIVPCAGHSASEPGILEALVRATDEMKNINVHL